MQSEPQLAQGGWLTPPLLVLVSRNERFKFVQINPAFATEMSVRVMDKNVVSGMFSPLLWACQSFGAAWTVMCDGHDDAL